MFVLCPHCEFLVGVDPRTGQPPTACPKCGQALESAQADEAPVVVEDAPDVAPDVVAPVEPAVESTPGPVKPQLDPDAIIAAISTKSRKSSRAKPRTETKPTPSEKVPAPPRRKRAERPTPAPVDAAPETKTTPAARPATPSLATRVASWWSSRKQAQPPASPDPVPAQPASETKRKASVRPIPSLRDRAAARAAAKHAQQVPEIEALSIGDAEPVVVETPVVEPPAVETAPVEEAPVKTAAVETAPVGVETARLETAPVETPTIDATTTEEKPVESAPAEAVDVAAPEVADTGSPEPAPLPPPEPRLTPRPASAPSFLRARTGPASRSTHWQQFATLGALSLLLVLQLLLAQRDALAADARWRPAIGALCTVARCALPAWREPDAFTMLSRDVRPHARAPGTLQIDASFRNDARWAQPWPRLVLTLSDIDGRVLGTRAFTAAEYLGARPTQNTLASGQSATVRLAVVEPAPGVVAFSFEFR